MTTRVNVRIDELALDERASTRAVEAEVARVLAAQAPGLAERTGAVAAEVARAVEGSVRR